MRDDPEVEIIAMLIDMNPKGVSTCLPGGILPLHWAAAASHPAVVELLLSVYPRGAECRTDNGKLPLHWLCGSSMPLYQNICKLLMTNPMSAAVTDAFGDLPLHILIKSDALPKISKECVLILLKYNPTAARTTDSWGFLPLQYIQLLVPDADLEIYRALFEIYPEAAKIPYRAVSSTISRHMTVLTKATELYSSTEDRTGWWKASHSWRYHITEVLRLYLSYFPNEYLNLFKEINWNARKEAVLLLYNSCNTDGCNTDSFNGDSCSHSKERERDVHRSRESSLLTFVFNYRDIWRKIIMYI